MSKKHSLHTLSYLFVKLGGFFLHLKQVTYYTKSFDFFVSSFDCLVVLIQSFSCYKAEQMSDYPFFWQHF